MKIRKIKPQDNSTIEKIIKSVFIEFDLDKVGTAYEDVETTMMYESYQGKKEIYYILEEHGKVLGGGGIKHLKNADSEICELQKMYFAPEIRGKGYGKKMFQRCLNAAKKFGYKRCYLESGLALEAAIHIYENNGFEHLNGPMGNTGHYSCGVWMIKDLQ
jgi:putative acetyltransferase